MESESRFIGIDPGKTGHIVMLNGEGKMVNHYKAPLIGRVYDKSEMMRILQTYCIGDRVFAVLENVHTNQMGGKSANFDLGHGKGLWEMALMALQISHTMIPPKEWQKQMWEGAKKQYKPTARKNKKGESVKKIDTKATSLIAAKMLMPRIDWRVEGKRGGYTTKIDDGFVDAYLIAEYCRRNFR